MEYTEHAGEDGEKYYEIKVGNGIAARIYDPGLAPLFAHADELFSSAEDALCYVNLFGQLSVGKSSALRVAAKLERALSLARGEAEPVQDAQSGRPS